MLAYVAILCHFFPKSDLAICPPSSCHAGSKFKKVIRKPNHAANNIGDMITSVSFPPLSKISREIDIRIGIFIFVSCESLNNSPANSLLISGDVYAPKIQTIIAMTKPAIGPAIATSNKMSRLIVRPFD